ncbi:hypothetical protein CCACVL1_23827 [Corchorus capsularis]|uniref:Uncharacterized protein n=1 Tax=Corchorus capsularis TaxID=210143 RepID=A0A1R3GS52_COCAP|nr:hypothetical protein CCACVL1_23827 [Corchorus capsularis]
MDGWRVDVDCGGGKDMSKYEGSSYNTKQR